MTGFQDHFSPVAATYARARPGYPPALFAWLAHSCAARDLAWDCATGSGQAAVGLRPWFARILATDASAAQLEQAQPDSGIDYRLAPAEHSGLPAASVDLITVAQALHWFDLPRFHREVRRVLKPDGLFAAWSYGTLRVADPDSRPPTDLSLYLTAGAGWKMGGSGGDRSIITLLLPHIRPCSR